MGLVLPTTLNQEQRAEFQSLYKKHFSIVLTDEEALEKGVRFLQFMTVIFENKDVFIDD